MAEMKTHDVLRRAADLVDKGWTQGTAARLADGTRTLFDDPDAASFCIIGAVNAVVAKGEGFSDGYFLYSLAVLRDFLKNRGEIDLAEEEDLGAWSDLGGWNDNPFRKKREVVDLLLEAARAEEEAYG